MAVIDDKNKEGGSGDPGKKSDEGKPEDGKKETKSSDDDDEEEDEGEEKTYTAAEMKKVKGEAKQRRLEARESAKKMKELEEKQARYDQALQMLTGKKGEDAIDPVKQAQTAANEKLRNAMLKSAIASAAKDARDVPLLLTSFKSRFADVTVDIDTETVDEDELKEVLDGLRKDKGFLFEDSSEPDPKEKGRLPHDRSPKPKNGSNHKSIWNNMVAQGRMGEANKYYAEHKADILAGI